MYRVKLLRGKYSILKFSFEAQSLSSLGFYLLCATVETAGSLWPRPDVHQDGVYSLPLNAPVCVCGRSWKIACLQMRLAVILLDFVATCLFELCHWLEPSRHANIRARSYPAGTCSKPPALCARLASPSRCLVRSDQTERCVGGLLSLLIGGSGGSSIALLFFFSSGCSQRGQCQICCKAIKGPGCDNWAW